MCYYFADILNTDDLILDNFLTDEIYYMKLA